MYTEWKRSNPNEDILFEKLYVHTRTFKVVELVGISEGYEYQHNATKNWKREYT